MPTLYGTLRSLRRWPITAQDGIQELVAQHAVLDGTPAHAALDPVPCLLQHVTGRRIRGEGHGVQFFQVVGGKSEAGEPCECACCVAATPARLAEPVTDLRRAMLYVVSEDCARASATAASASTVPTAAKEYARSVFMTVSRTRVNLLQGYDLCDDLEDFRPGFVVAFGRHHQHQSRIQYLESMLNALWHDDDVDRCLSFSPDETARPLAEK